MTNEPHTFELFLFASLLSGIAAVGSLIATDNPLTLRIIIGKFWFHGMAGGFLGLFAYEVLSWITKPMQAVWVAIGYGLGFIQVADVRSYFRTFLRSVAKQLPDGGDDGPK